MTFIDRNGKELTVDAALGDTILDVAHANGLDIEGTCEGCMACSTCHVIVEESWFGRLEEASEEEEDLLDLAFQVRPTSRLGCQVTVTTDLDGLVVNLPSQHFDLMET